jgi:hypothetical protein
MWLQKIMITNKLTAVLLVPALILVSIAEAETIQGVKAEGLCAIVDMSAEQCQLIALQRARASAIEQAAGVSVASSSLVTNMALAADFIKTYAKGFIVKEKVTWLPLGQYQKDASMPPIPEYHVSIVVDVTVPKSRIEPLGLKAKTNGKLYKNGDKSVIEISSVREARVAIFNITADDTVVMVFPNEHDKDNHIAGKGKLLYPNKDTKTELVMNTLEGHVRDAEAFLVVGVDAGHVRRLGEIFRPLAPMSFSNFFSKYADIADYSEDVMLTYEVVKGN